MDRKRRLVDDGFTQGCLLVVFQGFFNGPLVVFYRFFNDIYWCLTVCSTDTWCFPCLVFMRAILPIVQEDVAHRRNRRCGRLLGFLFIIVILMLDDEKCKGNKRKHNLFPVSSFLFDSTTSHLIDQFLPLPGPRSCWSRRSDLLDTSFLYTVRE